MTEARGDFAGRVLGTGMFDSSPLELSCDTCSGSVKADCIRGPVFGGKEWCSRRRGALVSLWLPLYYVSRGKWLTLSFVLQPVVQEI